MEQSYYRIEAQKDRPPVVRQVWREAEQVIAGRYAVFLLRIRQERADFSPCWTGWPPTGRRPTPSTPRSWGCSSSPTWTTTPARYGPICTGPSERKNAKRGLTVELLHPLSYAGKEMERYG